ncbi:MAG: hypothetical protein LBL87_03810 [Ruminococcus sp.]|jgi:hypothetical protein|nr:hypothetical protein [Ruminococcus sp.]
MNRKEKIKNAAIIFLVVMLILTLFSNTIMNWSLPEVAVQYPAYQSISQQITGNGTVEAADTYEVKTGSVKRITGVYVMKGDTVDEGQLLFTLEEGDSTDLTQAKNDLRAAQDEYDKLLLVNGDDYTLDELSIKNKEAELAEAKSKQENFAANTAAYEKAKAARIAAESALEDIKSQQSEVGAENAYGIYVYLPEKYADKLVAANSKLKKLNEQLEDGKAKLEELNAKLPTVDSDFISLREEVRKYENQVENIKMELSYIDQTTNGKTQEQILATAAKVAELQNALSTAAAGLEAAQSKYNQALTESSAATLLKTQIKNQTSLNKTINDNIDKATAEQVAIKAEINKDLGTQIQNATNTVTELTADEADAKTAVGGTKAEVDKSVSDLEYSVEELKVALENKKETAAVESGKSAIDIATKKVLLDELKEKVAKLEAENVDGARITAPVAGVLTSVNLVSGNETEAGGIAAEIAVVASGYNISFSVTNEQARRVNVGDVAEIQYYWGSDNITVTLAAIKADETDPSTKKKLVFKVEGDIQPGQQLNISLGQRAQQYQSVIPNSAIREDNNGKFVLQLEAKNSPIGSRYVAVRADITVIATDGKNTAVSGIDETLAVISTSSLPLTPGMQVRLANS